MHPANQKYIERVTQHLNALIQHAKVEVIPTQHYIEVHCTFEGLGHSQFRISYFETVNDSVLQEYLRNKLAMLLCYLAKLKYINYGV